MSIDLNSDRDIEALLVEAGTDWRRRQDFRDATAALEQFEKRPRRTRSVAHAVGGAVGLVATGALALTILIAGPLGLRLGAGGGLSASASPSGDTSSPAATATITLSPVELEAAQLAVIEAVNADPANFAGVYVEKNGGLVIQYVGTNAGRSKVEPTIREGLSVRWEKVEWNRGDLVRIATEIGERHMTGVFWVSVDTIHNRVEVKVGPTGSLDEVSRILAAQYGSVVDVTYSDDIIVAH